MSQPGVSRPTELPLAEARLPGFAPRGALLVLGIVLAVIEVRQDGLLALAIGLALAATMAPRYLLGWVLILVLALSQLARHAALTWQVLVLLAGIHLLHVLSMLVLELPWRSWVQPSVLVAPLVRFVVIQVPTQLLAVVLLVLLAPGAHGDRPVTVAAFAGVGIVALVGLILLLLLPRPDAA